MTDHARILAIAARSGGAVAETVLDGATIEEAAQGFIASKLRETGERGSEHAALMVESLDVTPEPAPPCPYGVMPREAGAGHWREWHRGHGCDKDPDVKP